LLTVFSSFGQTFFISLFSGEIRGTYNLTDGQFGTIYMIATLASAVTLVFVGKAVDRFSVSLVAAVIVSCLAAACWGMANVSSVPMLLGVIYALRLFGQGMMTHTSQTAIGRWYSAERGRAISLTTMGHQIGEAILPSLVLIAVAGCGWRFTWSIASLTLVIFALPSIVLLMRVERQPIIENSDVESPTHVRDWTRAEVMKDSVFWLLCLGILAPAFIGTSVFFHQIHIGELKEWSKELFASSFFLLSIATVGWTLISGWLVDKFGARTLLPFFLVPMAGGCLLLGFVRDPWAIYAFMFLLGCSYGFSCSVFGSIWPETYGTQHLGSIRAIAVAAMVFASALGPGVTGWCIDRSIGFEFQLILMAAYCIVASAGMLFVSHSLSKRARQENVAKQ
jgi:MFS family permease